MNIRDRELKRLEQYARGLGARVLYRRHKRGDPGAEWLVHQDGSTDLVLYTYPGQTKTRLILNFIHELGHHYAFVRRNRKEDPVTFEAFYKEGLRKRNADPKLPKEERKLIYLAEKSDANYRRAVWQEVDIKLPKWKLEMDIELDIWGYRQYWLKGNHPNAAEVDAKHDELKVKYASKNKAT